MSSEGKASLRIDYVLSTSEHRSLVTFKLEVYGETQIFVWVRVSLIKIFRGKKTETSCLKLDAVSYLQSDPQDGSISLYVKKSVEEEEKTKTLNTSKILSV